ncbi:MAG: protein kinase [Planctomycetales bacterium]|nr:protein kinase [Planctomycetales bacterium]
MSDAPVASGDLRFGQIALRNNLVTKAQLLECLEIQKKMAGLGIVPKKLGEILVDKKYLTEAQVRTIFRLQGQEGGHRSIAGYQILEKIGEGAMGAVFKAKQVSMDRLVAIKVLTPDLGKDSRFVGRFLSEARAVAKLSHVNIISGIDVGESNGVHYFAMEYVDGETLGARLRREGALPEAQAVEIALQIARALDHAHKHGLIHRDIKPDNIMIARNGVAKLLDLGLARMETPTSPARTEQGTALGTPNYISPEQARADSRVDIRADLYSLGATFYHMLTGEVPFTGAATVVMTRHISEPPVPPHFRRPGVGAGVSAVTLKAMEKDPADRYQSPTELIEDLDRVKRGEWPQGSGPPPEAMPASSAGDAPPAALPAEEAGDSGPHFPRRRRFRRRRR